ncbi:MAG: lipocalin family protein [Dehalococcoidia bacterium]
MKNKVFYIIILVIFSACSNGGKINLIDSDLSPKPTPIPYDLNLSLGSEISKNEFAHDNRLEWWYHNGHLKDEIGGKWGYHFVIFKSQSNDKDNYVAQVSISNLKTGEVFQLARADKGLNNSFSKNIGEIYISDWKYTIGPKPGEFHIQVLSDKINIDLYLESFQEPMLHNKIGWFQTSLGYSYYYTWPRQQTSGKIKIDDMQLIVNGESWFDHQWGDFFVPGKPAGWQWFGIMLDNGDNIMVSQSRDVKGRIESLYGTYQKNNGEVTHITDDIKIDVIDEWYSKKTKTTYPSGWKINLQEINLSFIVKPDILDQEISEGLPATQTYWEGKSTVFDEDYNNIGDAYVELSGYRDPVKIDWIK